VDVNSVDCGPADERSLYPRIADMKWTCRIGSGGAILLKNPQKIEMD
jgi:hypothetical protein